MKKYLVVSALVALLNPGVLLAQDQPAAPAPEVKAETAPAAPVAPPAEAPKKEVWKANAGASAIINSGNSSNETFGGSGLVSDKWDNNKVEAAANGAYGRADVAGVSTTNTRNWKTSLRYDRYITDPLSFFALGHLGSDKPAGFDLNYGGSLGFAHELVRTAPHFFKYEVGFDYTHEKRVTPPNQDVYSGRTFLQYKYTINKFSVAGQDAEFLFDVKHGKNVRINTLTSLTFKLTEVFAFQAGFGMRFDNVPVPGFKKTDTTTQLGLVATFL